MQKLAEVCIRRPVFAAMLILALVVVGAASYVRLGVDRFPSVDLPTVSVRTQLPGASTEEVETEISKRIEEAVNSVEGIDELRSISGPGASVVIVTFNLNRDIDTAAQDVRDRVAAVLRDLPKDATVPLISKVDNDQQPVLTVALAGDRPLRELTELADKVVKIRLERSAGVGEVRIVGGLERAVSVWVDADRLAAYQIPITAVRDAIARQNTDASGGNVTRGAREETLRTIGRLTDPRAFDDLVVATIGGSPVRVRDLGWAEDGTREQRSTARLNGVPTVVLEVRRQSGANTVAVIEEAKRSIAAAARELPAGVSLTEIQDQSRYIYAALHEINVHLILGSILASLVVFVFMRSWRSTAIAAVAIPASVVSTFGMMWALHFTLNTVTMLALVLMVGIVIDDAIVVLENIFRFVEEKGMSPFAAARAATADIGLAVMATTFSLVIIFIPVSFMSSISGRFLYQFGITAAVAVLVSLLVSFSLTPMMSARLLGSAAMEPHDPTGAPRSRRGFYRRLDAGYTRALSFTLRHRRAVALFSLGVMLSAVPLYGLIRQDYLPGNVDEGEFFVTVSAPQGTSLGSMDDIMRAIADEVRSLPGVRLVLATAGGGFIGSVNEGRAYVQLAPHGERVFSLSRLVRGVLSGDPLLAFRGNRSQREVMQEVRGRVRKYRDLRIAARNIAGFNIGGGSFEVDFVLRGPDLQVLSAYAERLRDRQESLGLVDADTTLKLDKPELRVQVDRARAADLRVDPERIGTAVRLMVGGDEEVSRFTDPSVNEDYKVQLRLREEDRADPETIGRLYVSREDGGLVQLSSVARIEQVQSASRIDRLDRQREVRLRSSVAPGFALADRLEALRAAVAGMNLPAGYTTRVSGRGRELERTFGEFVWAFALSIVFMYMILASQFENLVHPFTILLSLPISVPFALLSIWLAGHTLNLYSALGILVLFGVVKKNAILQIDHMNNLREAGLDRTAAILQGNRDRLRPILMTTLTFVAGMLPLAVGTGPGAEERRVIAVVVIGGQTLSLLLTLLATPVVYSLLDDLGFAFRRRRSAVPVPVDPTPETAASGRVDEKYDRASSDEGRR
ncbi:MAG: Cation/multidrug efflux pump, hydrophobic/amphiphilic exporter-1 (mainly G- bacteria), HAE1 family [Deltaproteobacteria bacterium CSP1-8]|nr:MAG: Cation/multidrug efflux pump, hydrophobic/amphiphilic exporter-1 (mainly G- bacteria), HAE1 family [Deltaproteobacteria bacterium CSP1-8]